MGFGLWVLGFGRVEVCDGRLMGTRIFVLLDCLIDHVIPNRTTAKFLCDRCFECLIFGPKSILDAPPNTEFVTFDARHTLRSTSDSIF